jgi:hypothetical protein
MVGHLSKELVVQGAVDLLASRPVRRLQPCGDGPLDLEVMPDALIGAVGRYRLQQLGCLGADGSLVQRLGDCVSAL